MISIDSEWQPVAFQEWQLVVDAILAGEQSVILRKGGIAEGKAGFQWQHDRFFLFPTRFHQQEEQVETHADGRARTIRPVGVEEGQVRFPAFVETIATRRVTSWEEVEALAPFHIWKEATIRERFEWGDEPGIFCAVIRSWRLSDPWVLEDRKSFGGCRSWIDLPTDEAGGWRDRLATAEPIDAACGRPDWGA